MREERQTYIRRNLKRLSLSSVRNCLSWEVWRSTRFRHERFDGEDSHPLMELPDPDTVYGSGHITTFEDFARTNHRRSRTFLSMEKKGRNPWRSFLEYTNRQERERRLYSDNVYPVYGRSFPDGNASGNAFLKQKCGEQFGTLKSSIIIPARNEEKFIEIWSVILNSTSRRTHTKVIVVDGMVKMEQEIS